MLAPRPARWIWLLVWLGIACRSTPRPAADQAGSVRLGTVTVHVVDDTAADPGLSEDLVRRALERGPPFANTGEALAVEAWGRVGVRDEPVPASARPVAPLSAVEVVVHVQAPKAIAAAFDGGVVEAHIVWPLQPGETGEAGFAEAADRAGAVIRARLQLAARVPGTVESLLRSDDVHLVLLALQSIASSRAVDHLDAVAALLDHADAEVAARAVDVVGELGDSRHAPLLIQHVRLADPGHTYRTYEALARLGGEQAQGFLRFAARNEDDRERRAAARLALDKLMRSTHPTEPRPALRGHRQ
ncbi:MAG: HEAT repeat domain-containing protein [Myxococcales bacterium FL481]|nr:MAG: HEAT repeat domain-containing protein [Myxococcales bacterium FL481]